MQYYKHVKDALRVAYLYAPSSIAFRKRAGWFVYNPKDACGSDAIPEFHIPRHNALPMPLNETAAQLLLGILRSAITKPARPRPVHKGHRGGIRLPPSAPRPVA